MVCWSAGCLVAREADSMEPNAGEWGKCADCQRERECDQKLARVCVLVRLLQKAGDPVVVLPTNYPTTTEADICFGVGVGMLGLRVENGNLCVTLPDGASADPSAREAARLRYACNAHRARGAPTHSKSRPHVQVRPKRTD